MKEIRLQKNNFKENVLDQKGYVLVDFWASWCGPCKMLAPVLSQIAEENDDIIVGKVRSACVKQRQIPSRTLL